MLRNYIKMAWRGLLRNKVYSIINIVGLTIGLTACLLVSTVVIDDLSYDRQWNNAGNIYRIITVDRNDKNAERKFPQSMSGIGPEMVKVFPEVKTYCRMQDRGVRLRFNATSDGVKLTSLAAEPTLWSVLDFTVTKGNPVNFTKGYTNLVLTEKLAKQYFGDKDPVGKIITDVPDYGKSNQYIITGVVKDIPSNTHLRADIIAITAPRNEDNIIRRQGYGTFMQQYLLLQPGTNASALAGKMTAWYNGLMDANNRGTSFQLQPITDAYLRSEGMSGVQVVAGSMRTVYIFSAVAVMLLFIACINFINLNISRLLSRMPEVGVRKVLGAARRQIVIQFLFESLMFFCLSFAAGMMLYSIFLESVEKYIGHPLTFNLHNNFYILVGTCLAVLMVSVLTGIYPALILSSQKPAATIKGNTNLNIGGTNFRKGLVVAQFAIAIIILLSTIVVHNQLSYMSHKDLGFNKDDLLKLDYTEWGPREKLFKQRVLSLPGVQNASYSSWYPAAGGAGNMAMLVNDPADKKNRLEVWYVNADIDFAATLGLHLKEGRMLDPKLHSDQLNVDSLGNKIYEPFNATVTNQPVIGTETTMKMLQLNALNTPYKQISGMPVGVVKDFNGESLHERTKPLFIRAVSSVDYGAMLIRVAPAANTAQLLDKLNAIWKDVYPDKIFSYEWINDLVNKQYATEYKLQQLFTLFSSLIMFLACLGLLGISIFTAQSRMKEIGVRKVLGASVANIAVMLSSNLVKLTIWAILIGSPLACYAMNKWLEGFAYRIHIAWWMFAVAGLAAVLIAVVTVSFQSVKAALANPVKSLRSE